MPSEIRESHDGLNPTKRHRSGATLAWEQGLELAG